MKKILGLIIAVILLLPSSLLPVKAHPGKTDSNGCHVCKTNCQKWGLGQGEYHCHNGNGSSSQNNSTPSPARDEPVAPVEKKIDYAAIGKEDGYNFKIKNPNKELSEAEYAYADSTYQSAYTTAYEKAEDELNEKSIKLARDNGENDAIKSEDYKLSSIPAGVITKVYEENYKKAFDDVDHNTKSELKDSADKQAFLLVFDGKEENKPAVYNLKKYDNVYTKELKDKTAVYEKEKKSVLEIAGKNGKADAEKKNSENYSFIKKYKDTKFYNEAKMVYDKSYKDNKSKGNLIFAIIALISHYLENLGMFKN